MSEGLGPLESYQWSAARVDQGVRFTKRFWVALGTILLVVVTTVLVWNQIVFSHQVSVLERQQAQYHADTVSRDNAIEKGIEATECENRSLSTILDYLQRSQAAEARHKAPPVFKYPAPC